ncbi:MAG: transglycosylase SLT domain-containing protein [Candidatus Dormibacteraeota bacterium]|nr:transglycosylase SLT domain-containing protein [Candidatus Dormibacteraeota bacterium]
MLLVVLSLARPAFADDITDQENQVKQRLSAASAAITKLDNQIAALEHSIADTQQRSDREREQLHVLARVLYAQPDGDNLVMTVVGSSSISDALTRVGDLASAAQQASRTRRALNRDLASLSAQKSQLVSDRKHQLDTRQQLEDEFNQLVQLEAQRQQAAQQAVGQSPAPAPPAAPAAAPSGGGSIQDIILTAFAPQGAGAQQWALRIAKCESGYNPNAVNRSSGASGLFQFMPSTWAHLPWAGQSVFDPVANAQAAAYYYQHSGPGPWSCK